MTPMKQIYRHEPENGIYGDCFRTVISCLLDMQHPLDVPHFYNKNDKDGGHKANVWLANMGLGYVELPLAGTLDAIHNWMLTLYPDIHYTILGTSANGFGHVVICLNGKIIHDPSIDDSGIVGPCQEDGNYWVGFIVKR